MSTPLPDRRPRHNPGSSQPAPKGAIVAVTVTISILAAFALGVLVGRSQSQQQSNDPTTAKQQNQPLDDTTQPQIEMLRPDGTKANVQPLPTDKPTTKQQSAPQKPAENATEKTVEDILENHPAPSETKTAQTAQKPAKAVAPTKAVSPPAAKGIYTVQIAAFRDRESAERLSLKLESRGYDAYVQRSNIDGKGIWYRVRVGTFADKSQAQNTAQKLEKKEGRSAYVTIR